MKLFISIILLIISFGANAQTPKKFQPISIGGSPNYKAIVKGAFRADSSTAIIKVADTTSQYIGDNMRNEDGLMIKWKDDFYMRDTLTRRWILQRELTYQYISADSIWEIHCSRILNRCDSFRRIGDGSGTGGGNGGGVTSVVAGTFMTGGNITTTGTINLDTANASILTRQRAENTYDPKRKYKKFVCSVHQNYQTGGILEFIVLESELTGTGYTTCTNTSTGNWDITIADILSPVSKMVVFTSTNTGGASLGIINVGLAPGHIYLLNGPSAYSFDNQLGKTSIELRIYD